MPDYEEDFDDIFQPKLTRADVRSEVERTLRDVASFTAQAVAGQQNAIREVSAKHPDFEERRSQMLAVLQDIPLLRDAVSSAEANPQLSPSLPQIYEAVYKASFAPNAAPASEPKLESQSQNASETDLSDEGTQYRAALASQRVDLSPENRKTLIAELEKRGVGNIEF